MFVFSLVNLKLCDFLIDLGHFLLCLSSIGLHSYSLCILVSFVHDCYSSDL